MDSQESKAKLYLLVAAINDEEDDEFCFSTRVESVARLGMQVTAPSIAAATYFSKSKRLPFRLFLIARHILALTGSSCCSPLNQAARSAPAVHKASVIYFFRAVERQSDSSLSILVGPQIKRSGRK